MGTGQFRLLGRARGADDPGAQVFGPLAGNQTHPASGGMHQNGVARLHPIGAAQKILGGHALEHHPGGLGEVNRLGEFD